MSFWHKWQNMFLQICYCMMTRFYIFGKCLLGWCSFHIIAVSQCQNAMYLLQITCPTTLCQFWHVEECRCTQVRCTPPAHWTQCYRVILHHVSLICGRIQMYPGQKYPPIKPSSTEPYYTMSVWHVEECRCTQVKCTPPANWTMCYRALLHHVSFTCGKLQM